MFQISIDYFRRVLSGCKAKLTGKKNADGTYTYKQNAAKHTHIVDARDVEVKSRLEEAKKDAKGTKLPNRDLYAKSLAGASDEIVASVPKAESFAKTMRNQRKGDHPKAPKSLNELVLKDIVTTTGQNFLMLDTGPHPTDRIVMFATKQAMEFLGKCDVIHMDGTVLSGPVLFNQMYTIHGSRGGWRMPLVFVLCTNRTTATYTTIFEKLKADQPTFNPKQINIDFEQATIKAIKEIFPEANIQCCYFHLLQSVVRNLSTNGLKERYEKEIEFSKEIRQMTGVAFLPIDKVRRGNRLKLILSFITILNF